MNELGYGEGYKYSHDFQNQFTTQEYLPDEITGTKLYEPGKNKKEDSIRDFLKLRWKNKYNY
jgi:putative ATPase